MTPIDLLQNLRDLGILLTPYPDGSIRYKAPNGVMTAALSAAMRTHKQELLDLLETFEERAAILEYDGGLSREEAEALAWQELMRG
jgi:hypothetical protein